MFSSMVPIIGLLVCTPIWAMRLDANATFFVNDNPCERPKAPEQCKALVKAAMAMESFQSLTDIGARIGHVLTAPFFNPEVARMSQECCQDGTDYDLFLDELVPTELRRTINDRITKHTAVFVIDMQRDFTVGSLGNPCYSSGGDSFTLAVASFIGAAMRKGAHIIASKDFHPDTHCSFAGMGESACKNTKDYAHEVTAASRYVNAFPPHCTWSVDAEGRAKPQGAPDSPFCKGFEARGEQGPPFCSDSSFIGSSFDETIHAALRAVPPAQIEVIFKGFNEKYDSFSAMPHSVSRSNGALALTSEEMQSTGGFALPKDRAAACHGFWDEDPQCYPTKEEMEQSDSRLRSISDILSERKIDNIIVVGLVYDFCVKETAIFTKELPNFANTPVTVLASLTRPSFDGRPGSPYTSFACDGPAEDDGFCTEGGGTRALYEKVLSDFKNNGVAVTRFAAPEGCSKMSNL